MWMPMEDRGLKSPGTGIIEDSVHPCGCCELNSNPLKE